MNFQEPDWKRYLRKAHSQWPHGVQNSFDKQMSPEVEQLVSKLLYSKEPESQKLLKTIRPLNEALCAEAQKFADREIFELSFYFNVFK